LKTEEKKGVSYYLNYEKKEKKQNVLAITHSQHKKKKKKKRKGKLVARLLRTTQEAVKIRNRCPHHTVASGGKREQYRVRDRKKKSCKLLHFTREAGEGGNKEASEGEEGGEINSCRYDRQKRKRGEPLNCPGRERLISIALHYR